MMMNFVTHAIVIATFLLVSSCGSGGGSANSVSTNSATGLVIVNSVEWESITSVENICTNTDRARNINTQLESIFGSVSELEINPREHNLRTGVVQKLGFLESMVNSANVEVTINVENLETISSANACIDDVIDVFSNLNLESGADAFNTLRTRIRLASASTPVVPTPSVTVPTSNPVVVEEEPRCAGTIDACGICDGPGVHTFYRDLDGDTLGNPVATQNACTAPAGYIADNTDTNDFCAGNTCYVSHNTSTSNVCNNDSGCSLRYALANADVVRFQIDSTEQADLTYLVTETIDITRNVVIHGCNQGQVSGECPDSRQIHLDASNMVEAGYLETLTLRIGNTGGINVDIYDLIIENNETSPAMRVFSSNLNLYGKTIIQNNTHRATGGILLGVRRGSATVTLNDNTKIRNNTANDLWSGSAVLLISGTLRMNDNSEISHNTNINDTAGIRITNLNTVEMNDNSRIHNNTSNNAGAIHGDNGIIVLNDSALIDSNTSNSVGAIRLFMDGHLRINSNTVRITNNTSRETDKAVLFDNFDHEQVGFGELNLAQSVSANVVITGNSDSNDFCTPTAITSRLTDFTGNTFKLVCE